MRKYGCLDGVCIQFFEPFKHKHNGIPITIAKRTRLVYPIAILQSGQQHNWCPSCIVEIEKSKTTFGFRAIYLCLMMHSIHAICVLCDNKSYFHDEQYRWIGGFGLRMRMRSGYLLSDKYWADLLRKIWIIAFGVREVCIVACLCVCMCLYWAQSSENMQCDAIHTWFMRRFIHVCPGENGQSIDTRKKCMRLKELREKNRIYLGYMQCYWLVLITLHIVNITVNIDYMRKYMNKKQSKNKM